MKNSKQRSGNSGADSSSRHGFTGRSGRLAILTALFLIVSTGVSLAHCDTMDGPVIKDAKLALDGNNINYALKWIQAADEPELKEAFALAMKVRKQGREAKTLADKYFFDTLVRLHRMGEGVGFTGVKPAGTPVDERILSADRAIEAGNLTPLAGKVSEEMKHELYILFDRVMALKNFDVNDVKAGREYVAAYVNFFKFAEGEEHTTAGGHSEKGAGTSAAPACGHQL